MKEVRELKTERLLIVPLTDDQLRQRLYDAVTPEEKRKYSELYAGVQIYPTHRLWCTLWEIVRKADGVTVGELYFGGPAVERGEAELHCCIYPDHQGSGYAGEAMKAVLKWAWKDEIVYFILAVPDHPDYRDTLRKLGFMETGARFELERPVKTRTKDLMSLGVSLGLFAGLFVLGSVNAGILMGAVAGWGIGSYFDAKDRRIREKLRGMRQ